MRACSAGKVAGRRHLLDLHDELYGGAGAHRDAVGQHDVLREGEGRRDSQLTDAATAPATAGTDADPASENAVINTFQQLRQDASQLFTKINELENEKAEHVLVIDAIKDLDPKRKCFRLIGGVLVERTVEEVLPAVNKNKEGLAAVIEKLMQQRDDKVDRVEYLQKKYKIRVKGEPDPEEDEDGDAGKQGVLA